MSLTAFPPSVQYVIKDYIVLLIFMLLIQNSLSMLVKLAFLESRTAVEQVVSWVGFVWFLLFSGFGVFLFTWC